MVGTEREREREDLQGEGCLKRIERKREGERGGSTGVEIGGSTVSD